MKIGIFSFNQSGEKFKPNDVDFNEIFEPYFNENVDILVIGLQESPMFPSFWHSSGNDPNNLMSHMGKFMQSKGYTLVKKGKSFGLGKEGLRGLRMRIFKKRELENTQFLSEFTMNCKVQKLGKGAIGFTIQTNDKKIFVVNAHLPFNVELENNAYEGRLECMENIIDFIKQSGVNKGFIFGDLNFRIKIENGKNIPDMFESFNFRKHKLEGNEMIKDELYLLMKNPIKDLQFFEGVDQKGPTFMPTCKFNTKKNCEKIEIDKGIISCYKLTVKRFGKETDRIPSYCDRIIYTNGITCNSYFSVYKDAMKKSDHMGVGGIYLF